MLLILGTGKNPVLVVVLVPVVVLLPVLVVLLVLVLVPVVLLVLVPVPVLVVVLVPVLDNIRTLIRFNSRISVCIIEEVELMNARHSRTVLIVANKGDTIAAVGQVAYISRYLAQEQWLL